MALQEHSAPFLGGGWRKRGWWRRGGGPSESEGIVSLYRAVSSAFSCKEFMQKATVSIFTIWKCNAGGTPYFGGGEEDEYSDAEDVGYVREYIRGQEAFAANEVDLSDGDHSQKGMRLYHQAKGLKSGHQVLPYNLYGKGGGGGRL